MLEKTKRIPVSFRISSVLSKVEPGAGAGPSHWLRLRQKITGSGSATLRPVGTLALCSRTVCYAQADKPISKGDSAKPQTSTKIAGQRKAFEKNGFTCFPNFLCGFSELCER